MVIFIIIINKQSKKKEIMGCGCKNKANQAQTPQQEVKTQQQSKVKTVNENIKKIVEKYYNKK